MVLGPCLNVRPGEVVTIESWSHALPWALALVREARRCRAEPVLVVEDEETFFASLTLSPSRSIVRSPPALVAGSDAYVYLPGPESFPRLFGLGDRDLHTIVARHGSAWWRAAERRRVRFARLSIAAATPTAAERFGIDLDSWQRQVWRSSLYPPGQLHRRGARLARRLARARRIRIRHPNGTDFSSEVAREGVIIEDARVDPSDRSVGHLGTQIPSGLVTVPLRAGTASGIWESNRRTYLRYLDPPTTLGARWAFREGRLKEYSFDRGGEAFAASYSRSGPGRDRVDRLTFGLNPAIGWAPELEEIEEHTITLWLGGEGGHGSRSRPPFSFGSPLAGAEVELDGTRWWVDGRTVPRRAGGSRTPSRR